MLKESVFPGLEGKSAKRIVGEIEGANASEGHNGVHLPALKQIMTETDLLKSGERLPIHFPQVSVSETAVFKLQHAETRWLKGSLSYILQQQQDMD